MTSPNPIELLRYHAQIKLTHAGNKVFAIAVYYGTFEPMTDHVRGPIWPYFCHDVQQSMRNKGLYSPVQ